MSNPPEGASGLTSDEAQLVDSAILERHAPSSAPDGPKAAADSQTGELSDQSSSDFQTAQHDDQKGATAPDSASDTAAKNSDEYPIESRSVAIICGSLVQETDTSLLRKEVQNWHDLFRETGLQVRTKTAIEAGVTEKENEIEKRPHVVVLLTWTSDISDNLSDTIDQLDGPQYVEVPKLVIFCREIDGNEDSKTNAEKEKKFLDEQCQHTWDSLHKNFCFIYMQGDRSNIRCFLADFYSAMTLPESENRFNDYRVIDSAVSCLPEELKNKLFYRINQSIKSLTLEARRFEDCLLTADKDLHQAKMKEVKKYNVDEAILGVCYSNNNKGLAYILAVKYNSASANDRRAIRIDVENLRNLFKWLRYDIEEDEAVDAASLKQKVENFSGRSTHEHKDSCILAVLAHGNRDVLVTNDGNCKTAELLSYMANSKTLAKKPRLCIFRACRNPPGSSVKNSGTNTISESDRPQDADRMARQHANRCSGISTAINVDVSPNSAGLIAAFSTTDNDFCHKNPISGSRFINALCRVYYEKAHEMDVVSMINWVNYTMTQSGRPNQDPAEWQVSSWTVQTVKQFYLSSWHPPTSSEAT